LSLGSVARVRLLLLGLAVVALGAAGCTPAAAGPTNSPATGGTITLYTSVTQDTVDAVLAALAQAHPDLHVNVFRAPTGQLDARIQAEQRSGGVQADVLWATDPLSTEAYSAQGLLAPLSGPGEDLSAVPSQYRTDTFVGTRLLNLVMVSGSGVQPQPVSWHDLTSAAYRDAVALPDPAFAGSAFAALAYFASTPDFGIDFYRQLKANGAVQVQAIGDVITNVANGTQKVGISLDKSVRDEVDKGSPIELVWPQPGAIAIYSPAAIFTSSSNPAAAATLVDFLVSVQGQTAIAGTGWQPIRADVPWNKSGPVVDVDWGQVFGEQQQLLDQYHAIFGQ
jgi:iron(III) transport system substrate-binding protein